MAPTTTEQHHSEEERPDSHNIWDKTFKITDRCDSDASVVFTDITEDARSFAESQQDTLDSFSLRGDASPLCSPLAKSPAADSPSEDKHTAEEYKELPAAFKTASTVEARLPNGIASPIAHHIQFSDKHVEKPDSIADETISVLSTTAVAGSIASAASLEGDLDARAARQSTDTAGRSSVQTDGPDALTLDVEVPREHVDSQEEGREQGMAGEDLYLMTPKKEGEDRSAEGIDTPPEEAETAPLQPPPFPSTEDKSTATPAALVDTKTRSTLEDTETSPDKAEVSPAAAEDTSTEESKEELEDADSALKAKIADIALKEEAVSPIKAAARQDSQVEGETAASTPEASEQSLSKKNESAAAQSPTTPENATPALGEAEESSQGSDPPTRVPTPLGSSSSLNPISEPFVPSKGSQELSQRANKSVPSSNKPLNAQAAAFVPGRPSAAPPASVSISGRNSFPTLQFGDLPDSLNASPHPTSQDQAEWSSQYNSYQGTGHDQGEWHADWAEYGYSGYGDPTYTQANGGGYYSQAEGSWAHGGEQAEGHWGHWNHQNGDANGWEHSTESEGKEWQYDADEAGGYSEYANGYSHQGANELADESQYRRRPRAGRGFRRFPDRRRGYDAPRGSWGDAAVDILEQQFGYSRDALQEMLELHEGNLEVALDMLAQLEAEKDGQLPASGQDAPELNEENFPSLGSCGSSKSQQPSPKKADFAAAVKTPSSAPPTPHPVDKKTFPASPAQATPKGEKQPWAETGAAVSELYDKARADAKDHARLRNQYFQEATKAYMAGSKALAKELGAKGREQSELMKAAHVSASQAIYKHRNPIAGRSKGKVPGLVDLHGLHVKEALSILEEQIEAARRLKPKTGRAMPHRLSVLVGTGHHTKGARTPARLPSAVEEWLKASQIPFSAPEPGILELTV